MSGNQVGSMSIALVSCTGAAAAPVCSPAAAAACWDPHCHVHGWSMELLYDRRYQQVSTQTRSVMLPVLVLCRYDLPVAVGPRSSGLSFGPVPSELYSLLASGAGGYSLSSIAGFSGNKGAKHRVCIVTGETKQNLLQDHLSTRAAHSDMETHTSSSLVFLHHAPIPVDSLHAVLCCRHVCCRRCCCSWSWSLHGCL